MNEREEKILEALAGMVLQYLDSVDGRMDNMCIGAGEDAIDVLSEYGLVEKENNRFSSWTEAGLRLLDKK